MLKLKYIENFLKEDDFNKLISSHLVEVPKDSIKIFHNKIDKNNNILENSFETSFLKLLHKNYHQKAFDILKELNLEKSKLYDYSDFSIVITGKNYKFPIHDDTPNKLLSGVIYLYPKKNVGTIFYSTKKGDSKKVVDWKQNLGIFFSRIEKETWHSYEGDNVSNRMALVYNLMTNRIKEVYKIENKSYIFGSIRWKLNPYLHRYFKKFI